MHTLLFSLSRDTVFVLIEHERPYRGVYDHKPGKPPIVALDELHQTQDNQKTLLDLLYLRQEYLKKSDWWSGVAPYQIHACDIIQPDSYETPLTVDYIPSGCADCYIRDEPDNVICPLRIAYMQKTEKQRLALQMGFRLME